MGCAGSLSRGRVLSRFRSAPVLSLSSAPFLPLLYPASAPFHSDLPPLRLSLTHGNFFLASSRATVAAKIGPLRGVPWHAVRAGCKVRMVGSTREPHKHARVGTGVGAPGSC